MPEQESTEDRNRRIIDEYLAKADDIEALRADFYAYLRRAIAEDDARRANPRTSDRPPSVMERANALLLERLREFGPFCWLVGPIALLRTRLFTLRSHVAAALRTASVGVEEASSVVATAALAIATLGSSMAVPAAAATTHVIQTGIAHSRIVEAGAASTFRSNRRTLGGLVDSSVLTRTSSSDVTPAPSGVVHAKAGTHRDGRRIYLTRWTYAWIPGGAVSSQGDGVWWACNPDSTVDQTVCATYDQIPEGPWSG